MEIPADVQSDIDALRAEIEKLAAGRWDQKANSTGSKQLRSLAKGIVLTAKKVEEAVKRTTHSYP